MWLKHTEKSEKLPNNEAMIPLSKNNTLTFLDVTEIACNAACLEAFASNTILQELVWEGAQLGNQGAQILARNVTLKKLDLKSNNIGELGAVALSENKTLSVLSLLSNPIHQQGYDALQKNKFIPYIFTDSNVPNHSPFPPRADGEK